MASKLHFIVIPFMAPGHFIPMVDISKLLSHHNPDDVTVTVVTTPFNASRIRRSSPSPLPFRLSTLPFPAADAGLPDGCESFELLPSPALGKNFVQACGMLQNPFEHLLQSLKPIPSCIVADRVLSSWTGDVASKFRIPLLVFDSTSCFNLLCTRNLLVSKAYEGVSGSDEPFVVPGLPDQVKFTRGQLPGIFSPNAPPDLVDDFAKIMKESDEKSYGVLINGFEELEMEYVKECRKAKWDNVDDDGDDDHRCRVWCIGPVSLCNNAESDKAGRGNKGTVDESHLLDWLHSQKPRSVVYACLGSLDHLETPQVVELGLALEASEKPFIWVIPGGSKGEEIEGWIAENGFEERVSKKGFLIRGWAPQVLILSHQSIGVFLTHCGWNSTLEGITSGVPLITWPMFAEQFVNEKFLVQILGIGVRVGIDKVVHPIPGDEKFGVLVKREQIKEAINKVMCEDKEGEDRRERARKLGEMAKAAVGIGGSSYLNLSSCIEEIKQITSNSQSN